MAGTKLVRLGKNVSFGKFSVNAVGLRMAEGKDGIVPFFRWRRLMVMIDTKD